MYPSMGMLDNWLPVLWELRQRRPDVKITALLPRPRVVAEIDLSDTAMRLGEQVFDEIVYKSRSGFWARAESFAQTKDIAGRSHAISSMIGTVRAVFWYLDTIRFLRPLTRPVAALVDKFLQRLGALCTGERYVELARIGRDATALCFDLFATTKRDGGEIVRQFRGASCFSLLHGLAVYEGAGLEGRLALRHKPPKITAYLYSRHEVVAYKKNYGLEDSEMKVVGVPRHEPRWIEKVLRESARDVPALWDGAYLFVVSRPAITEYLTVEKKRQALLDIRELAFADLGCRVVVGLHPTERVAKNKDVLYEEVFGRENYGRTWLYSSTHPFALGKNSLCTIVFYSGVVVDMLAIGVPVIERLTLNATDDGGKNNFPAFLAERQYRKNGLVLPAENYEELRTQAMRIMNERESVMERFRRQYAEFFGASTNPISLIVEDICEVL